MLSSGSCAVACLAGTYRNLTSNGCINCPTGCQTCSNSTYCSKCIQNYYLNSSKLCQYKLCTNGTYLSNLGTCDVCAPYCRTCFNAADCSEVLGYETSCASGYFKNALGNCYACPYGCSRCPHAFNCSVCKTGFYLNTTTKWCMPCTYPCKSCTSDTVCLAYA